MSDWFLKKRLTDPAFGASKPKGDAMFSSVRFNASESKGPCWEGYHRDYSKKEMTDGSCVKNGKKKRVKRASKKTDGVESSTDAASSGDEKKKKAKAEKD